MQVWFIPLADGCGVRRWNCEIRWERVPYLSALEVRSRQDAKQIHVYLTLPYLIAISIWIALWAWLKWSRDKHLPTMNTPRCRRRAVVRGSCTRQRSLRTRCCTYDRPLHRRGCSRTNRESDRRTTVVSSRPACTVRPDHTGIRRTDLHQATNTLQRVRAFVALITRNSKRLTTRWWLGIYRLGLQ